MGKPKIFLSHITEESTLAGLFKVEIENAFLGLVDVFQSSDPESLPLGQNWLNNITDALKNCHAILLFCSPYSISRPWINFECGAGWARAIEVAPLCHSGLRPVDLPLPMSLLQGVEANDSHKIELVFRMISRKLGSTVPTFDLSALATRVAEFEKTYSRERNLSERIRRLRAISKPLFDIFLKVSPNVTTPINDVPQALVERARETLEQLQSTGHFSFNYSVRGVAFGGEGGNFGPMTVHFDGEFFTALQHESK